LAERLAWDQEAEGSNPFMLIVTVAQKEEHRFVKPGVRVQFPSVTFDAYVAQLAERRPSKLEVPGSIPGVRIWAFFGQRGCRLIGKAPAINRLHVGSNPTIRILVPVQAAKLNWQSCGLLSRRVWVRVPRPPLSGSCCRRSSMAERRFRKSEAAGSSPADGFYS
jgi:hypothetical protein